MRSRSEPPADTDIRPDPSAVTISGRAIVFSWTNERLSDLGKLTALANKFGLHVHELPLADGDNARASWSHRRISLDYAVSFVRRAGTTGVYFDDWAALWDAPDGQKTLAAKVAARRKAQVALHRAAKEGRLVKSKDEVDGRLILRAPEHAK